jgi:hypothetical protein
MPVAPATITKPKLLLGEGTEEVRFFKALLTHLGISDVQVEQFGGKNNLSNYVPAIARTAGFLQLTSLAITRDADNDAAAAFASVCYSLQSVSLAKPPAPGQFIGSSPRVGTFILPDNQKAGMLEDLCLAAVATDPTMQCVEDYFLCLSRIPNRRQPNNPAKARVHAWLASQVEPDKQLGVAADIGYLDWHSPAFAPLIQFLKTL